LPARAKKRESEGRGPGRDAIETIISCRSEIAVSIAIGVEDEAFAGAPHENEGLPKLVR
jgi:hypothetical protein